jgi:hypothetical protein
VTTPATHQATHTPLPVKPITQVPLPAPSVYGPTNTPSPP